MSSARVDSNTLETIGLPMNKEESKSKIWEWRPASHISPLPGSKPFTLLILNQPITNIPVFRTVFRNANFKICADGGANRLKDIGDDWNEGESCLPNVIHGDLDSLRSDAREYYERNGVKVVRDDDQYSTDFMKCLKYINKKSDTLSVFLNSATHPSIPVDVVAVGGLGGRVDQGLSQIHHLYAASNDPNLQLGDVYLLSPESISFVLRQGRNVVYTPDVKESTSTFSRGEILSENVGIVPIGRPAVITTKGFEWDVSNWKTEFGGQISTSNHIKNKVVEVETSESILFTVELASLE